MKKFISQYEYNNSHGSYEPINSLPGLTVPDKSYTIKQILERSIAGALPPIAQAAQFTGDNIVARNLDKTYLDDALNALKRRNLLDREKAKQALIDKQLKDAEENKAKIIAEYEASKIENS